MSADDDLPPPLEDMSEFLHTRRQSSAPLAQPAPVFRINPSSASASAATTSTPSVPATSNVTGSRPGETKVAPPVTAQPIAKKAESSMFSGLKGGFFGQSKPKPASSSTSSKAPAAAVNSSSRSDDIPMIRPNAAASNQSGGVILPEVQEAMKSTIANTDWTAPDFMSKLDGDDFLSRALADPRTAVVMQEMSKNPAEALKKYGSDPRLQEFIRRFMGLMAGHLTDKADKEDASTTAAPQQSKKQSNTSNDEFVIREAPKSQLYVADQPRQVDPQQMQQWLSDPKLRAVLNDPGTVTMLADIRADPRKYKKYENDARFKMLVSAGIIARE